MRLIEAVFPADKTDRVREKVEGCHPTHYRFIDGQENNACVLRAFFAENGAQQLVDDLQNMLGGEDNWRILVLPVEATAPQPERVEISDEEKVSQKKIALREEIYSDAARGAELSVDFYILTFASTIVAAIGLNTNNVAAVIGAMVIAPLLGPILAFSFASALGDFQLLMRAARSAGAGLLLGFLTAMGIGLVAGVNFESQELMSRTVAGLDSIFIGLAAGVAAALSIVTGVSAALVGVMVAVALLPPAAAAGLFLGAGEVELFWRAILLLTVNVVCILLAAQGVYFFKGVRPRTWVEKSKARKATRLNFAILIILLAGLAVVLVLGPVNVLPGNSG